jgi:hypothetical protein
VADEQEGDAPAIPPGDEHVEMGAALDQIEAALDDVAATISRMG